MAIELGYVDQERVARAIEESRSAGVPPEKVLLERKAITSDQLSRGIAERYGLDHIDLDVFNVDMGAANLLSASDIHFEPQPDPASRSGHELRVRMRIDGVMTEAATVPRRMVSGVVSRIKIMSDLDISERRLPQDGRVGLAVEGRHVDVRVVTLPSVNGESVVLRILDKEASRLELERLGMQEHELERFRRSFNRSYGAVLATGPTGSGKSTSLYGALGELNTPEKNIITIEDPVEYQIPGITQVQINPKAGLTFATGLRSMMRADPDILMVGEIRDRETAQIAIEGALTGHMVLSTLHTNDAPTAITRLVEMWGSSRSWSPRRSTAWSHNGSPARSARTASSARSSVPTSCATTASRPSSTSRPTSRSAACAAAGWATRAGSGCSRSW